MKTSLLEPDESGFQYTTTQTHVGSYSIQTPLVPAPHKPRGGWKIILNVKGQHTTVIGDFASHVINNASQILVLNRIPFTSLNLWFNANIQWVERAIEKYQRVKIENLLEIADIHAMSEQGLHEKPHYDVSKWAEKAFGALELYLTTSNYSYEKFLNLCEEVRSWMNPVENIVMGSALYYTKITLKLAQLKKIPLYQQSEARKWLVDTALYMGVKIDITRWN